MNFLQRTPFFRLLLPFILGIFIYQYVEFPQWSLYALLAASVSFVVAPFAIRIPTKQFQFRWFFGCGIFLFFFVLSLFRSSEREKETVFDRIHQQGIYRVELIAAPVEKAKSYMCKAEVVQFFDSTHWVTSHGKAILYFQKDSVASKLIFGDRLLVRAEFTAPEQVQNPEAFDYATYLKRQGISGTCYIPAGDWIKNEHSSMFSVQREADKCRQYLLNIYRKFEIKDSEFAVLAALTLGYTDDLDPDLRASYSASGAMHILAVSGMHVGVVFAVLAFLLSFLNKTNRQKTLKVIIITLFLWTYAFLTGLSPSVVRATCMFSFVAVGSCLERKSQIYNTIFMSALVMLLYNPNYLFHVGFQLSYSAVLSIVFFQPVFSKFYKPSNKLIHFFWEILSVSVAAQIGTMPFTLYYFHQFSNYFLLTNIIALPLSSAIIYLAISLMAISFIPYLSLAVAFLLKWLLITLNFLIVTIQQLPFSVWYFSLDSKQLFLLIFFIVLISVYFYTKKYLPLVLALGSFLLVCLINLQINYNTFTNSRMIVYAGQKNTHVSFIDRNRNYLFTTDSVEIERIAKAFWQNQKLNKAQNVRTANWFSEGFVCFNGMRILILDQYFLKKQTSEQALRLDYLIIGQGLKPKIEQVLQFVHPKKIIVDRSITKWYAEAIKQACKQHHIDYYSVAEKGAYVLNIVD